MGPLSGALVIEQADPSRAVRDIAFFLSAQAEFVDGTEGTKARTVHADAVSHIAKFRTQVDNLRQKIDEDIALESSENGANARQTALNQMTNAVEPVVS